MNDRDDPIAALARDIARIEALREQGRLDADEAQRLIDVLRGDPELDAAVASDGAASTPGGATASESPAIAGLAAPAAAVATAPAAPAARPDVDEAGVEWLAVDLLATDLEITVADVAEPRLREGGDHVRLQRHGAGWRLDAPDQRRPWSFFGLEHAADPVRVDLPGGMGVDLDVKAGDVRIVGVGHVRGRMLAGDLDVEAASHVSIDKKAGDLDVTLRPTSGTQRIDAKAGDVNVTLLPGSDVRVSAVVTVGDLRVVGPAVSGSRTSRGVGSSYEGTIGGGAAELTLRLTAGSLRLRAEGEGA